MTLSRNALLKYPEFNFHRKYVILFCALAIAAWGLNFLGQFAFPSANVVPYFIRTTITLIIVLLLIKLTVYLLNKCGLPGNLVGSPVVRRVFVNLSIGTVIGSVIILMLMTGLYLFNPFRIVNGNLHGWMLLRECYWYLLNNTIEELMFRGFLLLLLIRIVDWQRAALVMALPFGLFHLSYAGFFPEGFKMVLTTMSLSFVFSYSFILTGSIFTAIAVHVSMNILNHAMLGLDGAGKAAYIPVFSNRWPINYDPGFIVTIVVGIAVAFLLFLLIKFRNRRYAIYE